MDKDTEFLNRHVDQPTTSTIDGKKYFSKEDYTHSIENGCQHLNRLQDMHPTIHEESETFTGGKTELDEYLTNIKWLSQLSCKGLIPQLEINCTETKSFKTCRSQSKERPPKSYSEIIHLAISSSQAKRMTLKQIYTWVEDHFPYYRDCAKPGWKNSIRHTLSTRDIFVRETGENEKVTFWTLKTHSDSNLSQIKTFPLQGEQLSSLHSVKSHKSSMACSGILAAGFLGRTQTRWQPKSKKSHKEEKREKRIKPILPRGSAAVLIPVLVGPPLASANVQKSAQLKKARPALIAPKLPFLLQNQNVYPERFVQPVKETSVLEATTWKVTEPQRIVSKRWKGYRARRHEYRRTRKPRSCHQRHIGCPSSETNLNVMSPMNSSPTNQSSYVNVLISPSKTPSQMAVPEGVSTSTPCKHAATVLSPTSMLLSLLPGITPPKVEDDVLDFSLLKSPNDESLGYISLGFPDSIPTTSEPEDPDHDLGELQGFAPIDNDSFTETLGADQHNESFSKFFSDYSTPNLVSLEQRLLTSLLRDRDACLIPSSMGRCPLPSKDEKKLGTVLETQMAVLLLYLIFPLRGVLLLLDLHFRKHNHRSPNTVS
ncbi:hypothetical protein NDU88_002584 [Pleurodeles waltl]|uniref:Fork-head domain-containing protein n=1 Tax=Pleurodeles waltl TaxID=8319 RepID=A0AAV7TKX7_PLEWA|nr:hypothetical protein NDU88_002584 [Pleurodeles waltl]